MEKSLYITQNVAQRRQRKEQRSETTPGYYKPFVWKPEGPHTTPSSLQTDSILI